MQNIKYYELQNIQICYNHLAINLTFSMKYIMNTTKPAVSIHYNTK